MIISIKFGGFYGGPHDQKVDSMVNIYEFEGEEFDKYSELYEEYAKNYVDFLNYELGLDMKFVELDRPRFYNYRTDEIVVEIDDNEVDRYIARVDDYMEEAGMREDLEEYIIEKTTRSDGYIPYYTKDEVLMAENKDVLLQCMFAVLCRETEDEWESYYDLNSIYEIIFSV